MCADASKPHQFIDEDTIGQRIVGKLAFYPPHPSTCISKLAWRSRLMTVSVSEMDQISEKDGKVKVIIDVKKIHIEYEDGKDFDVHYIPVESETIVLFHIKHENPKGAMIFCHGNAVDCGATLPRCISLSLLFGFDVFAFDYDGYGLSSGEPSEACLRRDILTIYDHVFHLIQKNIYLYGESIGSYPCCFLATQKGVHIQGIVLHSAVVSADHILRVSCLPNRCDSFNNLKLASKIHVPVFQIHGVKDHLIPLKHAKKLARVLHSSYKPWYVWNCGHDSIPSRRWSDYCRRLYTFIESTRENWNEDLIVIQSQFSNEKNYEEKVSTTKQIEMIEMKPIVSAPSTRRDSEPSIKSNIYSSTHNICNSTVYS